MLMKKVHGFRILEEGISWWLNSKFSHIEPILAPDGKSVDYTFPHARLNNINSYNSDWRMIIIRPVNFTPDQSLLWLRTIVETINIKYDLVSYFGFLANKQIQDKDKLNCAEAVLLADQSAGLLTMHDGMFISPQSYWEYTVAGLFQTIAEIGG